MKHVIIVVMLFASFSVCFSQTPNMVKVSRWYFNGVPNIQGLTTIKDNGMPNKVWFTETDSQKLGYVALNKCKEAKLTEYLIAPIYPYKITYAEKPFVVQSGKTKYNANVWFTTTTNTDSLYTLIADRRTTYVVGYPTGDPLLVPSLIRWQAKDRIGSAKLWFTNATWDDNCIYSFEPQASSQSVFPGIIRIYTMPDAGTIMTLRVQNDYVWSTLHGANDTIYLYGMSLSSGSVMRWNLGTELGTGGERDVQPVYNKNNPKALELPYQVWITGENGIAIVRIDANAKQPVDSLCITLNPVGNFSRGLFSCPASMKKNTSNWTFLLTTFEPDSDYVSALRAKPVTPIQRISYSSQIRLTNVNGVRHPITTVKTVLKSVCGYKQVASIQRDCLTDDWNTQYDPTIKFNFFSQLGPVDIKGKMSPTHFDLVFHEAVTSVDTTGYTSTIDWVSGDYKAFINHISSMNEQQPFDEDGVGESKFALDEAYPNPFNPTTSINYTLPATSIVTLKVFNMLGQEVATLVNQETMDEGSHAIEFNAGSLPSGMYFCRIVANELGDGIEQSATTHTAIKKLLLMK